MCALSPTVTCSNSPKQSRAKPKEYSFISFWIFILLGKPCIEYFFPKANYASSWSLNSQATLTIKDNQLEPVSYNLVQTVWQHTCCCDLPCLLINNCSSMNSGSDLLSSAAFKKGISDKES